MNTLRTTPVSLLHFHAKYAHIMDSITFKIPNKTCCFLLIIVGSFNSGKSLFL